MVRGNRDALKLLARALEETELAHGNLTRGLELLEPVLEVVPTQASEALQKAADIREESGSLKGANEAIDLLRVAMRVEPANAALWNHLGLIHERQGSNDVAFKSYIQATKLDPKDADSYNNAANLVYRDGNASAAMAIYDLAKEIAPHADATIHYNRAVLAFDMGDFRRQRTHMRAAQSIALRDRWARSLTSEEGEARGRAP